MAHVQDLHSNIDAGCEPVAGPSGPVRRLKPATTPTMNPANPITLKALIVASKVLLRLQAFLSPDFYLPPPLPLPPLLPSLQPIIGFYVLSAILYTPVAALSPAASPPSLVYFCYVPIPPRGYLHLDASVFYSTTKCTSPICAKYHDITVVIFTCPPCSIDKFPGVFPS